MKKNKLKEFIASPKTMHLVFFIIALILIIFQLILELFWKDSYPTIKLTLLSFIGGTASIFGVGSAWEWIQKNSFKKQLMQDMGMTNSIINSGIIEYCETFKEIKWKDELKKVKLLEAFITFGTSWIDDNEEIFQEFIKNGGQMLVIFPDYNDDSVMKALELKFPKLKVSDIKKRIKASIDSCENLSINVKLYKGIITSTYYFLDDKCFFSPYQHTGEKATVPALKIQEGYFYEFCKKDMEHIKQASQDISSISDKKNSKAVEGLSNSLKRKSSKVS